MLSLPIKITFMKKIYLLFAFFAVVNSAIAQEKGGKFFEIGLEFQLYPTGYLAAIRGEIGLAPHHAVDFRVGYNGLDHGDNGVHNTEVGGGLGGSLGYRYYFNPAHKKWFIGARADLWNNDIDWSDPIPDSSEIIEGNSQVLVLQPTAIGGYRWEVSDHFAITGTVAFGAEINIITNGAQTGEGAIVLGGLNVTYRF